VSDGVAAVQYAMNELRFNSSSIALVGQSLGTAVVSGTVEHYASLKPAVDFASVVLVSPFSDLKTMLLKYRIGGVFPILAPLARFPALQQYAVGTLKEIWDSKTRIRNAFFNLAEDIKAGTRRSLTLYIFHAEDDADIPFENSQRLFDAALDGWTTGIVSFMGSYGHQDGRKWLRINARNQVELQVLKYGGHNQIGSSTEVAAAILDGFGLLQAKRPQPCIPQPCTET
jgi:abhydrolase domain-containing protein 12